MCRATTPRPPWNQIGQDGWICPSGLRFPKPALIYPSSTLSRGTQRRRLVTVSKRSDSDNIAETSMCPDGALVWNRTSVSCASGRRHHQIGYDDNFVAGVVPGHGHRRLFGCQRAHALHNEIVRGRGFEPRRTGSKPVGLPLADPRAVVFRDEGSNLDICVQSAVACR